MSVAEHILVHCLATVGLIYLLSESVVLRTTRLEIIARLAIVSLSAADTAAALFYCTRCLGFWVGLSLGVVWLVTGMIGPADVPLMALFSTATARLLWPAVLREESSLAYDLEREDERRRKGSGSVDSESSTPCRDDRDSA